MLLSAVDLTKTYEGGQAAVPALRGVSVSVEAGEFVALTGPSGCGKSTLLHLCGAMDRPSSGEITFEGRTLQAMGDDDLTRLRRVRIGFVFQFFNLLPTLTVVENIALPLMLGGTPAARARAQALALAGRVGVSHRAGHFPQQLSGGEMQRVAIARAVVHRPALLIADEPTGNLDSKNGERVLELLQELNAELGVGVLLATHDPDVADAAYRTLHMRDGVIERVDERRGANPRDGVPHAMTTAPSSQRSRPHDL